MRGKVFTVPTFDPTDAQFRFDFTAPDGETYSIPKIQYVPMPVMEAAQAKGGVGFLELIKEIDPKVGAVVASFAPAQLKALETAWITESGSSVGESSASAS
jgi:hypothetical protein